jgi:outer membrane protein
MIRRGVLITALAASTSLAGAAFAQSGPEAAPTTYGPSLQAPGPDTPPVAIASEPMQGLPDYSTGGRPRPQSSAGTPTLNDALAQVYLTYPALLSERAHLRSVDEDVPTALSGWRPQITYTLQPGFGYGTIGSQQNVFKKTPTGIVPGIQDTTQANSRWVFSQNVQANQYIYRGGRTTSAVAQAENDVRAERANLLAEEEQAFSNAVAAYVGVIEDEQLYELNVSNVQVLSKTLEATNARFSAGEITRTDVAQAQAALAGAIAQRETAYGTLQTARATYLQVIGVLPDKLVEPQPLAPPVHSAVQADTLAAANNAAVVAAEFNDAAAKDAVDAAYAAVMPQVSLQVTAFYENQPTSRGQIIRGGIAGGNIQAPIYQGGAEYAGIRQAKQNEQQSRKQVDDARRTAVQEATQYWEAYVAAKATVVATRSQITADEIALDGVEREALAGTQTTLDVLNAEQLLLSARTTLVQNLASLVSDSYSLAGAIGRLTARDLALNVPMYDDSAYYNAVRDLPFGTDDAATHEPGR